MNNDDISRLRWQCRRGMLELDTLLLDFLDQRYAALTKEEQWVFQQLLTSPDPELFSWLMGREQPADIAFQKLVAMIRPLHSSSGEPRSDE